MPALPPIGIVVSNRGAGKPTDWPNAAGELNAIAPNNAAKNMAPSDIRKRLPEAQRLSVIMRLVIEQEFFGVD
jgi:hypothetical protein